MSFNKCVAQIQVGQHHKHVPRQKCESIMSKKAHSIFSRSSSSFKWAVCLSGISCWVSLLNAQNSQTCSFIIRRVPSSQAVHSGFSPPSFRFFVSGCPTSTGSFVGTDWCLVTASPLGLFVSRFGLGALGIEREESSGMRLVNAFPAQP